MNTRRLHPALLASGVRTRVDAVKIGVQLPMTGPLVTWLAVTARH